jgi:hypothetical protein
MAKKTAKKKSSTKKSSSSPKLPAGESTYSEVIRHLLDKLPPLHATMRAALRSLASDADRSELGCQTKARGVLPEGVSMAVRIDRALGTFPSVAEAYPKARFAYFLESLLALDALVAASDSSKEKIGAARGAATTQHDRAAKARRKLIKRLGRYAGLREAERKELAALPPQGRTNEDLRRSIQKAADLAESWLARKDAESAALAHAAALDDGLVKRAREAAAALGGADVGATLEGRRSSHDSPVVNLEEGNVLLEMDHAIDVFEEEHEENDVVPRLIPGPATRHVLGKSARRGANGEAATPAAGGGDKAAPAANPAGG